MFIISFQNSQKSKDDGVFNFVRTCSDDCKHNQNDSDFGYVFLDLYDVRRFCKCGLTDDFFTKAAEVKI